MSSPTAGTPADGEGTVCTEVKPPGMVSAIATVISGATVNRRSSNFANRDLGLMGTG